MSNAIRFTEMSTGKREIQVTLSVAPTPPTDDTCTPPSEFQRLQTSDDSPLVYLYMSIKDSGPGLQQEDLALLFQRYVFLSESLACS
jgi:signal transduction histidine kinase